MERPRHFLPVAPLTAAAFAAYGDVIEASEQATPRTINGGFALRYHDLAQVDVTNSGGRPAISIFRARPRAMPFQLQRMERHPLGSQAFMPLNARPFLVVVAPPGADLAPGQIRCFRAAGHQGVNYARGAWHHPLIAITAQSDFLVVDRRADPGQPNLETVVVTDESLWVTV